MDLNFLSALELRQICYFLTIVDNGNNFSRAAERLYIEQPPLSQRIRTLEKKLKIQLFDRRRRPLQLTAAGEIFAREVRLALEQFQSAIAQAQRAEQGEVGHLSIGVASSVANGILPEILRAYGDRYPQVELELRELTADQQVQALRDRRLDLGIEVFPAKTHSDAALVQIPLVHESLVAVFPEDHPHLQLAQISLTDLAQELLILPSLQAFPFYQSFLDRCLEVGFQPKLVQNKTATWMLTLLSLVAAGVGIAILPSNVLSLQRQGVVYRDISDLNLIRQISLMYHCENKAIVLSNFVALVQSLDLVPQ